MTASMAPRYRVLSQIQRLQTVAVEVSTQLRNQGMQVLQNQAISLEDIADTELEDISHMDQCMDELMQCILYTELRKDIRHMATALDDMQYELFSTRQNTFILSKNQPMRESEDSNSSGNDHTPQSPAVPSHIDASSEIRKQEPQLNPASASASASAGPSDTDTNSLLQLDSQSLAKTMDTLEHMENKLYDICLEVDEWRRTRCIHELINKVNSRSPVSPSSPQPPRTGTGIGIRSDGGNGGSERSPSQSSFRSMHIPVEQIIQEARIRKKKRANSVGDGSRPPLHTSMGLGTSSLRLGASPPASRLLQVEREAEAMRLLPSGSSMHSSSPRYTPTSPSSHDALPSPSGAPLDAQFNTLHLIDENTDNDDSSTSHRRTYADDVRIIGWETKGSGLDVHTEFKVVAHLTRGENLTVMRRYTDFVLLREVLCRRYHVFRKRIPHLPPKQAFGKFENKFLKKRESGLQFFLAYVALHPVIGTSSVVKKWFEG